MSGASAQVGTPDGWVALPPIEQPAPVLALAARSDSLWAGGFGGVVGHRSDAGWSPRRAGMHPAPATALAIAGDRVFAAGPSGIFRTRDDGQESTTTSTTPWEACDTGGESAIVTALVASPGFARDHTILAATLGGGVLRSDSDGERWRPATFGLQTLDATALAWVEGETVLAGTADGIYRSPNAGRAWRGCPGTEDQPIAALAVFADGAALAATEAGELLSTAHPTESWSLLADAALPTDLAPTAMLASASGVVWLATLSHGLMRSIDRGLSWTHALPDAVLALTAVDESVFVGTASGVVVSVDDGVSWNSFPSSPLHDLTRLLLTEDGPIVFGLHSPPMRFHDGAWRRLPTPLPSAAMALAPDGTLVAAGPAGITWSDDGGQTWQEATGTAATVAHVTFRAAGKDGQGWAASADGASLLRSIDAGRSWQPLAAPFGRRPLIALQATARDVLAVTYDTHRRRAHLWRSPDDGQRWGEVADVATTSAQAAVCAAHPAVALGTTLFVPEAGGRWSRRPLPAAPVRRLAGDGDRIAALTPSGLFWSTDSGEHWRREDVGLPTAEVEDLALAGGTLWVLLSEGRVVLAPVKGLVPDAARA